MAVYLSPRRSPDSLDEELADINNEWSAPCDRELLRARRPGPIPIVCVGDSDEDTEDASEDGEVRHQEPEETVEIKEQVYFDKMGLLRTHLEELEAGNYPEFNWRLTKVDKSSKERIKLNEAWRDYESGCIERDFIQEKKSALRDFEDKKVEVRENLMSELEEKKKQIELERYSMELTVDLAEIKPVSTRKLRRRPNEPIPVPEKRRKTPQSQITFLLDERDVDDDLRLITKGNGFTQSPKKASNSSSTSQGVTQATVELAPVVSDARIEDGKLFYEKRWFHRGQPVYVLEGKDLQRVSGVISGISPDTIWVRKVGDQSKFRVLLTQLVKGKCSIKRRA